VIPLEIVAAGLLALGTAAVVLSWFRWLRVAQREHYIAGWVSILWLLWLRKRPLNAVLVGVAIVLFVLTFVVPSLELWAVALQVAGLALVAVLPLGLGVRGRSSRLAWTARLKRVAVVYGVLVLACAALAVVLLGARSLVVIVLAMPALMDLVLAVLGPIEKRLSHKYLVSARKRLSQVGPRIVAITGSYGKTSTKGYVAHVLSGSYSTVASPASFNNLMGLSRAVNERVVPGTEIFVAEMGVYGQGEIRELSKTFTPDIAAITTIGEAHLARMGSREVIFKAKSEITERANTVVLPIDDPLLLGLAAVCESQGKRVIRVSTRSKDDGADAEGADVIVADGMVRVGAETAPVSISGVGHAVNVAVAVGIAVALDVPLASIASRLGSLPDSPHRAEVQEAATGVIVVDDTYNSNPVGAARAVEGAARLAAERGAELIVVTPGMVELGRVQYDRNRALGAQVAAVGGHLFVIGRTNRAALVNGAAEGAHAPRVFARRGPAVAAALDQASGRGVILYENDLPDHYP
jgi:UDP-N-acetylmuramoyl-tripeptide--D-alanyl-D-alanine ligase